MRSFLLLVFVVSMVGCGFSIRFDPNSVAPGDTIGVIAARGSFRTRSSTGTGTLNRSLVLDSNNIRVALRELDLYQKVDLRFREEASRVMKTSFSRIAVAAAAASSDDEPYYIAAARKTGLDKVVLLTTYLALIDISDPDKSYSWIPELTVGAEMIRTRDERVLWRAKETATGRSAIEAVNMPNLDAAFQPLVDEVVAELVAHLELPRGP